MKVLEVRGATHVNKDGVEVKMIFVKVDTENEYIRLLEKRDAQKNPIGFDAMVKVVADYTLDTLGNQLVMREHEEHGKYLILSTTVMGDRIL